MGYSLHIHRREDWSSQGQDIELEEWSAVIETDPELELREVFSDTNPATGEKIEIPGNGYAVYTLSGGEQVAWFNFTRGRIDAHYVGDEVVLKACQIAGELAARVQGDEGEFYRPDCSTYSE